jgi:hypothetical protein
MIAVGGEFASSLWNASPPAIVRIVSEIDPGHRIFRWDLDKTYLRTEFDTVRDLLRTAMEPPARKRTVPGAAAILRELRATGPAGVYILSGSPEQMRKRLEQKLLLDGIQWDGFTLKPVLKKLSRGHIRFLRDQVAYKLGALLESRASVEPFTVETLFGDDAEADAFVYSLYAEVIAGRISESSILAVLEASGAYEDDVSRILELAREIPKSEAIHRIFIHLDRVRPADSFVELGSRVCPFYNYLQPALVLVEEDVLDAAAALRVGAAILQERGMSPEALGASFDDLARRNFIGRKTAEALLEARDAELATARVKKAMAELFRDLESKARRLPEAVPAGTSEIDFTSLYGRDHALARAAKARVRRRRR